jgi:hypothetical protein
MMLLLALLGQFNRENERPLLIVQIFQRNFSQA